MNFYINIYELMGYKNVKNIEFKNLVYVHQIL